MKTFNNIFQKFILIYLVLYIVPYGFEYIMELDLNPSSPSFWTSITTWFGETFLGWEYNMKRLMKGFDSKYDYARFLLITILSLFLSVLWQILSSKLNFLKVNVRTWIITIIRYHVGLTLILYGLSKVLTLQFGQIDLITLESKFGSFTGMQLLWRFMSYSEFYTEVTGYIEVIAGILLLFRRTTFLGTALSLIAMLNVVIIDIGYDVSVKMFAIHLLLMVIVLAGYSSKRIFQFFANIKADIEPTKYESLIPNRFKIVRYILKAGIIIYFSISQYNFQGKRLDRKNTKNDAPSLSGVYFVKNLTLNGQQDSIPENKKWETIFINGSSYLKNSMLIKNEDGSRKYYSTKTDTVNKTILFYPLRGKEEDSQTFNYKKLDDKEFIFDGIINGDTISISTKYKSIDDYRLVKSKIKWIRDL